MITRFKQNVSVKIASILFLVFIWVFVTGIFIVLHLMDFSTSLSELYDRASIEEQYANEVINGMVETSYYAKLFLIGQEKNDIDNFERSFDELQSLLAEDETKQEIEQIHNDYLAVRELVKQFGISFSGVADSVDRIHQSKNQIINELTVKNIDSFMELYSSSIVTSESDLTSEIGKVQTATQNIYHDILSYIVSMDETYLVNVEKYYIDASQALDVLRNRVDRGEELTAIDNLTTSLENINSLLQDIKVDVQQIRLRRQNELDEIPSEVTQQVKKIDQDHKIDTETQIMLLKENNINFMGVMAGLYLLLMGIGIFYVRWITKHISRPIKKIIAAVDDVAQHDLKIFTSDLELLSRGNIAVGSDFISQPVYFNQVDEIGQMGESINRLIFQLKTTEKVFYAMVDYLNRMSTTASNIRQNNLDIQIPVESGNDILGNALLKLVENLKEANNQVQEQLNQLSTLRQIDTLISTNIDLRPSLQFILEQAVCLFGFKWGYLILFDEKGENIKEEFISSTLPFSNLSWMEKSARYIRYRNLPIYLDDIKNLLDEEIVGLLRNNLVKAWYGEILTIKGQFRGVFQLFHIENVIKDEQRISFFSTLVGQAILAVEHADLLQNLETKVESRTIELNLRALQTQTAAEISHAATSTLQLDELMNKSVNLIQERFNMNYVGIFLVDEKNENAWLRAATGNEGKMMLEDSFYLPLMETSMVGWSILKGKPRVASNILHDPVHYHNPLLPGTRSEVALPLVTRDQVIGALSVQSNQYSTFQPFEITILQTIADQLANTIANARLYQESQRERNFLESIIRTSSVAVVIMDMDESILVWNPAAEYLFGWSAAEALGKRLIDLVIPLDQETEAKSFRQLIGDGKPVHQLTRRKRKDGVLVEVELSATLVKVEGGQAGILVLYHDITELQYSRNMAEMATKAKSEFLANISHEIRTPMNAVLAVSSLLLETSLSASQRDYAETIRSSSETLLALLTDVLDFSKIEARRLELEIQPYDLRECIESALDLIAFKAAEKNLDIGYYIYPDTPNVLLGDVIRLRQVLINILNNAVKFTDSGEVVVEVKSKSGQDENTYEFLFIVKDTGIGIAQEDFSKLFQTFSQADVSTTRRYGGTGLGLAISQQLVELMGGRIWVESSGVSGDGSSFHFSIISQTLDAGNEGTVTESETQILRGVRTLVGLPTSTSTDLLIQQMLLWGVQINHQTKPVDILNLLNNNSFSSVLLDSRYLDEFYDQASTNKQKPLENFITKTNPSVRSKLILITNKGGSSNFESDNVICLEKPVKPKTLLNILKVLRDKSQKSDIPDVSLGLMSEEWPLELLVVEDDPVNQKIFTLVLAQLGYKAEIADNGYSALEKIHTRSYDVIFMDIHMPLLNGIETSKLILTEFGNTRPIVFALTADDQIEDRMKYTNSGMDGYLSKPIILSELRNLLFSVNGIKEKREDKRLRLDKLEKLSKTSKSTNLPEAIINPDLLNDYFPQHSPKDRQALFELINLFIEETPNRINDLRRAQETNDLELARNAAHTLKGTSLTFGAVRLSSTAKQLEIEIQSGNIVNLKELINVIDIEFQQAVDELKRIGSLV